MAEIIVLSPTFGKFWVRTAHVNLLILLEWIVLNVHWLTYTQINVNWLSLKSSIDAHSLADERQELKQMIVNSGGSKGVARDAPGVQILSISCSLWNFGKIVCWRPWRFGVPPLPRGNPGSATGEAYPLGFLAESKQNLFESHWPHKYVYKHVLSRCFKKKKFQICVEVNEVRD